MIIFVDEKDGKAQASHQEFRRLSNQVLPTILSELQIEAEASECEISVAYEFAGILPKTRVLIIDGPDFERPVLPGCGSYLYSAFRLGVKSRRFVELSPRTTGLRQVLHDNWEALPTISAVRLADFILTMEDVTTTGHEVLTSLADLEKQSRKNDGFVLTRRAKQLATQNNVATTVSCADGILRLNALTLYGWQHETQDLGITEIAVSEEGAVTIGERETLCDPTFSEIPRIRY